jgi:hypothetical protein
LTAGLGSKYRYAIVACARWEDRYIVEWLTYYQILGFDHVFLYCNDDDPGPLYLKVLPFTLGAHPFVTFRYYPHQGQQPQIYADFLNRDRKNCEWISFFDIDEFLRLSPGETIEHFMRRFDDDIECVMFNWLFFGPNGYKTPPDGNVLEAYTRRENDVHCLTKYVAKSAIFENSRFYTFDEEHWFWHNPLYIDANIRAVNVLGEPMNDYYQGFPDAPGRFVNQPERKAGIIATAVIHHYAFRSELAFLSRVDRGLQGSFGAQIKWKEVREGDWYEQYLANVNATSDATLENFWRDRAKAAWQLNILARQSGQLISKNKNATQSSISEWSRRPTIEEDASGAVNGQIDGQWKFHTAKETCPWWQVDLGACAKIDEVRIFNTTSDTNFRFKRFALNVSIDGESWVEIFRKEDDQKIGGVDGEAFAWTGPGFAWARFVRITLLDENFLHLDQIEVYGEFADVRPLHDQKTWPKSGV